MSEQHNHKALYTSLGLLLLAVVLLVIVVGVMYYKGKQAAVAPQRQIQEQATQPVPTVQQTPQEQLRQSVTPAPVTTKQDLTTQQNALDNTDMTTITTGLDQNSKDASQFAQ